MYKYLILLSSMPVFAGNLMDQLYQKWHVDMLQRQALRTRNHARGPKRKKLRRYSDSVVIKVQPRRSHHPKYKVAKHLRLL